MNEPTYKTETDSLAQKTNYSQLPKGKGVGVGVGTNYEYGISRYEQIHEIDKQ